MTDPCAVKHCDQAARWTITIAGHPNNTTGTLVVRYCTEHAQRLALWEDSPKPYTVTIEGPTQ